MFATFVKKEMSKKEWEFFGKVPIYMGLGKTGFGIGENISAAFVTASPDGNAPFGTQLLDNEELRRLDVYYKANNIYPQPFEAVRVKEKTDHANWDTNKEIIKDWLHKKKGMFKV